MPEIDLIGFPASTSMFETGGKVLSDQAKSPDLSTGISCWQEDKPETSPSEPHSLI